jgi:predicted translin family RNA/ssDNA-binding protein
MAVSQKEHNKTVRPETSETMMSAEEMKQKVDEFGERLQRLKAQEVDASKQWLEELGRQHEKLKHALEEYNELLTVAGEQVQTNYQNLRDYVTAWAELTNAFNRAFDRGRNSGSRDRQQDRQQYEAEGARQ